MGLRSVGFVPAPPDFAQHFPIEHSFWRPGRCVALVDVPFKELLLRLLVLISPKSARRACVVSFPQLRKLYLTPTIELLLVFRL